MKCSQNIYGFTEQHFIKRGSKKANSSPIYKCSTVKSLKLTPMTCALSDHYEQRTPYKMWLHQPGSVVVSLCKHQRKSWSTTYSTMVSRSAMSPSTMRWMMLLCSSSDRFLWETRGVLYLVAGDGSTPCSQAWLSISSREARCLGSLWSMRSIRLRKMRKGERGKHT